MSRPMSPIASPRARLRTAGALAALACLCAAGPASATVTYTGSGEPPAPVRSGDTLISHTGEWVCVPECFPPSYEWQRCTTTCRTVAGRRGRTYALGTADVGTRIRSLITVSDSLLSASETRASAQTGPIALSAAPARPRPRAKLMRPFPVVVVAGRLRRGRTVVGALVVRGPRGARVEVRCRGRGCPLRRTRARIGRRKRVRLRSAERAYRAGTVLDVRVTARGRIGKFTRIRFRRRSAPARRDACLKPGSRRPVRCP